MTDETEHKEAAIIRRVFAPGAVYGHAENVLHRLAHLKLRLSHDEAVDQLHREVTDPE